LIIKFEYDGKSWSYDDDSLTIKQGIAVEEHIGGPLVDFDEGLARGRAACYQALGWLIFHDGDPDIPIEGVDFPVSKLSAPWLNARLAAIREAQAAVDEAKAAAGPTAAPSGQGASSTREPSPRFSGSGRGKSTGSPSGSSTT